VVSLCVSLPFANIPPTPSIARVFSRPSGSASLCLPACLVLVIPVVFVHRDVCLLPLAPKPNCPSHGLSSSALVASATRGRGRRAAPASQFLSDSSRDSASAQPSVLAVHAAADQGKPCRRVRPLALLPDVVELRTRVPAYVRRYHLGIASQPTDAASTSDCPALACPCIWCDGNPTPARPPSIGPFSVTHSRLFSDEWPCKPDQSRPTHSLFRPCRVPQDCLF